MSLVDAQAPRVSLESDDLDNTSQTADLPASSIFRLSEITAFWLLIAILAWAPFPLGSNRPWSWSVLMLLIALAWGAWALSVWSSAAAAKELSLRLVVPIGLAV